MGKGLLTSGGNDGTGLRVVRDDTTQTGAEAAIKAVQDDEVFSAAAAVPAAVPAVPAAEIEAVRSCVPLHARYYNEQHQGKFLWRERCASLTSTTCGSSTEWPNGSGGRCSWSDQPYGLGLTNHHLSHWN